MREELRDDPDPVLLAVLEVAVLLKGGGGVGDECAVGSGRGGRRGEPWRVRPLALDVGTVLICV